MFVFHVHCLCSRLSSTSSPRVFQRRGCKKIGCQSRNCWGGRFAGKLGGLSRHIHKQKTQQREGRALTDVTSLFPVLFLLCSLSPVSLPMRPSQNHKKTVSVVFQTDRDRCSTKQTRGWDEEKKNWWSRHVVFPMRASDEAGGADVPVSWPAPVTRHPRVLAARRVRVTTGARLFSLLFSFSPSSNCPLKSCSVTQHPRNGF